MRILVSILLLISGASFAQVAQVQNSPYNFVRGTFNDSMLTIPRGCDTVALPRTKYGEPTNGALYYDTCANTLYVKNTFGWNAVTGGLDSLNFASVLDSTGNASFQVLYAQGNRIVGSITMRFDTATNTFIAERITAQQGLIDTLYISTPPETVANYDPSTDADNFVLLWDATTGLVKVADWAASVPASTDNLDSVVQRGNWTTDSLNIKPSGTNVVSIYSIAGGPFRFGEILVSNTQTAAMTKVFSDGFQFGNTLGTLQNIGPRNTSVINGTNYLPDTTNGNLSVGVKVNGTTVMAGTNGITDIGTIGGDFVPYEGATRKVRLTDFGLRTDHVDFQITPTAADSTARLNWDSVYGTLEVHLKGNNVHLQIGQENVVLIHNNTGSTLTDGQMVYLNGSTGNIPSVALANNTSFLTASKTLGMVTETIAHGAEGYVTTFGIINGLNTLAYTEGDALWLGSTAGSVTNVLPVAPANITLVGIVVKRAGGDGSIFISPQPGFDTAYIRNQYTAQESKAAWVRKLRADSLLVDNLTGFLRADGGLVSVGSVVDSVALRRYGTTLARNFRTFNAGGQTAAAAIVNQSSTTADSSNILMGYNVGTALTTGYRNYLMGDNAGASLTTGHSNVGIGYGSLGSSASAATTGTLSVAIGHNALRVHRTGNAKVAIGSSAGAGSTTGTNFTAIGNAALDGATTGDANTAVGSQAMRTITTGEHNTGVGNGVGESGGNTTNNSYLGAQAGSATTGNNNTSIGRWSGRGTTGANNTTLGYYAGSNGGATGISGTNNTVIGAGAKPMSLSGDNQFTVWAGANNATGAGGGTAGYNVLSRNSSGQWLFNQTTSEVTSIASGAALEINGTTGGLLTPRLTGTQQAAIGTPATGLLIYNTDSTAFTYYNGSAWTKLSAATGGSGTVTSVATGLGLTGGPITTSGTVSLDTASATVLSQQRAAATYNPIIDTATGILSGDVTMTTSGTTYNGPSVTIGAGMWMLYTKGTFTNTAASAKTTMYIFNGTTNISGGASSPINVSPRETTITDFAIVSPVSSTTYTVTAISSANGTIMNTNTQIGTGPQATKIIAIKIR